MPTALPQTHLPGAIPTLNGRGFMLEALDSYATAFVAAAAAATGEVLDIGCAYGVASLAALKLGARVCACDMEPGHLAYVTEQAQAVRRGALRTVVGVLPDVNFAPQSFDAILASRVIHFLTGPDVRATLKHMHAWLKPGGQLFLVVDTPYMPGWNSIVPAYEAAKAKGEPWPGFIPDFAAVVSNRALQQPGPEFLNTLDPDILVRECAAAGFVVERASFFGLQRLGNAANGREHAGCTARKPG
ncbi:MAG: class I SAM-dependent methyltransferase [Rhodospirillaceae bacterium]|nr:class I SAM-dependent methyltransferase [Rhodospirillaceae bacterium]